MKQYLLSLLIKPYVFWLHKVFLKKIAEFLKLNKNL